MTYRAAARSVPLDLTDPFAVVLPLWALYRMGWTRSMVRAQLDARRWQRLGRAIVLHNGPLNAAEQRVVALINAGPRSLFTGFTAAEGHGLQGWERPWTDVLVPAGARVRRTSEAPVRVHYVNDWSSVRIHRGRWAERLEPALLRAATTFANPRPACGLLAAAVQQRLLRPSALVDEVASMPNLRHRRLLLAAAHDITQGAQALSEIDFARLCRRHGLPVPERQVVRRGPGGRRRYLDAEWIRARDGQRIVAEVDGALHLIVRRWWDDQLRQNELVIAGDDVLRFASVLVRCEEPLVVDQLRRILL